ncbi:MAG: hypothetical protein RL220_463 [Bacteroidota bacterium]|jgi:uncharacterized membrane protein
MNTANDDGRSVAILAYMWIPGWVIALILNGKNPTPLGSFHIRQALGIWIISLFIPFRWTMWSIGIITAILWLIGLISAVNSEEKPIPFIGQYFQDWFKGL